MGVYGCVAMWVGKCKHADTKRTVVQNIRNDQVHMLILLSTSERYLHFFHT